MKKDLLKPIDLKLKRSSEQVNAICLEIEAWIKTNPVTFKCAFREGHMGYIIKVDKFDVFDLTDRWGVLVGELMHNLRSTLDNLAYALACLHNNPPAKPDKIYFPIFKDEAAFNGKTIPHLASQLSVDAFTLVRNFQPFNRIKPEIDGSPETDPLVHLQWYNNVDKHRIPTVVFIAPTGDIQSSIGVEFATAEEALANTPPNIEVFGYPLHPDMTVLEHRTTHAINAVQGDLNYSTIVSIQGQTTTEPLIFTVQNVHAYVAAVVEHFRFLFQQ